MPDITVTRTYLEMTAPGELRPAPIDDPALRVERLDPCPVARYRALYDAVGRDYHWRDLHAWTDRRLADYLSLPTVSVWELRRDGETVGWFDLQRHDDGGVEIVHFGLLPGFHGRGLGKHLLTLAVGEAWRTGARHVWLHTCTLDHPAALPNYRARGFRETRTETYVATLP